MSLPVARVTAAGARRVRDGLPWVFRIDVPAPAEVPAGGAVRVVDPTGNPLGMAWQAASSKIALRMLTRKEETIDRAFFAARLDRALALRALTNEGADAARLVHGEADLLPGLFVDRYGDALSIQAASEGADAALPLFAELLRERLSPRVIVAANDGSAREYEGLPRERRLLHGGPDARAAYHEGQNRFEVDLLGGHKTGGFLDQRENHVAVAGYVRPGGRALDVFSYHGGFALALATRAGSVTAVEQDEGAAAQLRANALANGRAVEVIAGNGFDELRRLEAAGERFDTVVIDPPAFAKRKGDVAAARRAYKELFLRGLKLLSPGGVLVACSCSGKFTRALFEELLDEVIVDAKRPVQLLERRGAARDHPVLPLVPETEYLKCHVLRALA